VLKAVILDFDGTLAVLNIDFSTIKEEILNLIERYGVTRESLREKYLLEIIDEAYSMLLKRNNSGRRPKRYWWRKNWRRLLRVIFYRE
jgi:beta-phosphoglucomutase-like phosphatase (HAD superfamily)